MTLIYKLRVDTYGNYFSYIIITNIKYSFLNAHKRGRNEHKRRKKSLIRSLTWRVVFDGPLDRDENIF